ncbi:DNA polymerase III subunit delta [Alloscardovia venturai]|uniref:DNA-directed DNA polymerase n=1 Tax=Alloscardovia venturai TaxID=1769421 RepID=A0ABW2Y892_9BIFI
MTLSAVYVVNGGDEYLNSQRLHALIHDVSIQIPHMERIDADAAMMDEYAFVEAISPSLLSDGALLCIDNLENASEKLTAEIEKFAQKHRVYAVGDSVVICRKNPGQKGSGIVNRLKKAKAQIIDVPQLKNSRDYKSFITGELEKRGRFMRSDAMELIAGVLTGRTGEIASLCEQLCNDFDENPLTVDIVSQYLIANPQVTGFNVADKAMAGNVAGAIIDMRNAVLQGTQPIAIIGALAANIRNIAKVAAVESGQVSREEVKMTNSWLYSRARGNLRGWTSQGLAACIQMLAWADEQCKTSGADPLYALEKVLEAIASHGRVTVSEMNS